MRNLLQKIDIDKSIKYGTLATTIIGVCYVLYYYFSHCFSTQQTFRYNLYFVIVMSLIIAPTVYITKLIYLGKEFCYSRIYVVLAICWGIAMQLVLPPISGVDETTHVISAFRTSNIMMGIEDGGRGDTEYTNGWVDGVSYFWMRQCDVDGYIEVDLTFPKQFEYIANGEWFHTDNTEMTEFSRAPAEWYRYIPSALGITIGRLLHMGFYGTIFLGRLMNTLLFVLIGWFCIKILPVGKLQVILFALLPSTLNLCNSFSYDNMSIMFSLLLFSLILHYSKEDTVVHFWDLFIIIANVIILMPNKIVYAVFMLWIFAIPFKKWKAIILSKKWYEYVGIGVFVVVADIARRTVGWKYFWIARKYVMWKSETDGIEQDPTRASYTWDYIVNNPWETIKFSLSGIKSTFWYDLKHCIGCEIGMVKLNAPINIRWTILLLLVILASYFIVGRGKMVGKKQLIVMLLVNALVLLCIFIGCLVRFTPTDGTNHVQISYRYLMPIYMVIMLIFGNDKKENRNALCLIHIENLTLLFALTSVLTYLFTR